LTIQPSELKILIRPSFAAACILLVNLEEFSMFGKKKLTGWIAVVAVAMLLAACAPEATPTTDPAEIRTQVANTVQAGLTQTAAAEPTSTPTNTPEPTSTPTVATPTLSVTSTAAATATSTYAVAADQAEVIDVSASKTYTPGQSFSVTWTVKNIGDTTWSSSYQVRCFTTAYCFGGATTSFGQEVEPGDTITLTINLVAPSTTGDLSTLWVLTNSSGVNFGTGLSYSFKVSGTSATATKTVTSAPTATATTAATIAPTATE
jgi:hypothetical protein